MSKRKVVTTKFGNEYVDIQKMTPQQIKIWVKSQSPPVKKLTSKEFKIWENIPMTKKKLIKVIGI
jgi:hypothetical protein